MPGRSTRIPGASRLRIGPSATALILSLALPAAAVGGESLQPGFYYHDPGSIRLVDARSGAVCEENGRPAGVCEKAHNIVITGEQTCDYPPDKRYPCTRFGYEFDYEGAEPGTVLDCTVRRTDPRGQRTSDRYSHKLDAASGHVFRTDFRTFAPVEERLIFSEVHDCAYRGERLSTIEFIIRYEPGAGGDGGAGDADPYFPEVPDACAGPYLTERRAQGLVDATSVRKHAASEHIPTFWSQCIYGARGQDRGEVSYVFKFMLSDLYDVDKVDRRQLEFNVTFGQGNVPPKEVREDLGDLAFLFDKGNRTTLFVISGIKGPKDGAGRPTELIANYYIEDPDLDYEIRRDRLLEQARRHLEEWHGDSM